MNTELLMNLSPPLSGGLFVLDALKLAAAIFLLAAVIP